MFAIDFLPFVANCCNLGHKWRSKASQNKTETNENNENSNSNGFVKMIFHGYGPKSFGRNNCHCPESYPVDGIQKPICNVHTVKLIRQILVTPFFRFDDSAIRWWMEILSFKWNRSRWLNLLHLFRHTSSVCVYCAGSIIVLYPLGWAEKRQSIGFQYLNNGTAIHRNVCVCNKLSASIASHTPDSFFIVTWHVTSAAAAVAATMTQDNFRTLLFLWLNFHRQIVFVN